METTEDENKSAPSDALPELADFTESDIDQSWDANAEKLTRESGIAEGVLNMNATNIMELWL